VHLYLHVPFCARRCSYCDFSIAVRRQTPSAEYAEAVLGEWQAWLADPIWDRSPRVETIYLGGGTPSRLDPAALGRILDRVRADRPVAGEAEITLEANPDDVTPARAADWRRLGVNRVSLGVQSLDPAVLRWMHRTHNAEQVPGAVATLRTAGFDNLSLDLIYAVPGELGRDWRRDLDRVLALAPEHLSLYGLTVEPRTPLGRWVARGNARPMPEDGAASEYLEAHAVLSAAGFEHYEVSNAARPGYRSRHNSAYWTRAAFLGLGPSGHGGEAGARWWNVRGWTEYLARSRAGLPVLGAREELDPAAQRLEELYLGLRTEAGLPVGRVPPALAARWEDAGWARLGEGRIRLTPEGWLRLDALVAAVPDP